MCPDTNWAQLIQQAALDILGEPDKRHRGEWRYRSRGSLVINVGGRRAGTWMDFEAGTGGGVLDFLEHFSGLDCAQAFSGGTGTLARRAGGSISHRPRPDVGTKARLDLVRSLWASSGPIPTSPGHAARRWLRRRKLWWPDLPLPPAVRWLDGRRPHTGVGSIIALAAPPSAWVDTWPQLPPPAAVQLVHVNADGRPTLDRPAKNGGLPKRTLGRARDTVLVIGNPILNQALTSVRVAEGLADVLALGSRYPGPVVCAFGTSGLRSAALAKWLVGSTHGVLIHSDRDPPKDGRPPAGRRAAALLSRAIRHAGGTADIIPPAVGFKDFAEETAAGPDFVPLPEECSGFAQTMAEPHPDWPPLEIARISAIGTAYGNDRNC